MILLCNGDSWTQGDSPAQTINWEATKTEDWYDIVPNFGYTNEHAKHILYKFYDSNVWPKVLGKKLGVETWNAGRLGVDNFSILRRTIWAVEWLLSQGKKDIFVVIGWTSHTRVPSFIKQEDGRYTFSQTRPYLVEGLTRENFTTYCTVKENFASDIISLQSYLNTKNIRYLFFNAFDYLENDFNDYFKNAIDVSNWVNCTYSAGHFKEYILQKYNLKGWQDSKYFKSIHPTDISHIEWGKFLFNYIKTL